MNNKRSTSTVWRIVATEKKLEFMPQQKWDNKSTRKHNQSAADSQRLVNMIFKT